MARLALSRQIKLHGTAGRKTVDSSTRDARSKAHHGVPPITACTFFNPSEAATVEAMAARIIPGDPASPGAREAGVLPYIDRAVAGFYQDLQTLYRRGVHELNHLCRSRYDAGFVELSEVDQDAVLAQLEAPVLAPSDGAHAPIAANPEAQTQEEAATLFSEQALLTRFFMVVRAHTIEGMFCDPVYGGNYDAAGWKLIGFPGAQWGYSAEQMQPGFDASQISISTLGDLYREHGRSIERGEAE